MSKKTGSKSKLTKIILLVVLVIIAVGAGSLAYFDSQYNARIAKDKQRFETALADINKFFDKANPHISNRHESRYCTYFQGPYGDSGDPQCSIVSEAKYNVSSVSTVRELMRNNISVLGWNNLKRPEDYPNRQDDLLWYAGEHNDLSCYMSTRKDSLEKGNIEAICYGRAEAQHYPRVDR